MRKFLPFIAICALFPALLASGETSADGKAQTTENIFELPVTKLPPQNFRVEAAFSKEMQTDCNLAFLLGGKLEEKEDENGIYYEFSGGDELAQTLMLCEGEKKKRSVYYEFTQILPYISPVKIVTPKGVRAEIRIFERVKTIKPKNHKNLKGKSK